MTNEVKKVAFARHWDALVKEIATSGDDSLTPEDIQQEVERMLTRKEESGSLFTVHTAGQWMAHSSLRPTPQMLFSEFWHEGELCILFADTNLGKSILAVQIGNSISRGEPIAGFKLQAAAQPTLYFDFELSEKQFEARYSNAYTDHYAFNDHFYRAEMNADAELPGEHTCFEDYLQTGIVQAIEQTGARVLIIDNLTYLKTETERAQNALPLMKQLKALKQRYNLSILALAHTPKRDSSHPISKNDLQGSKMLMNFCDSAFAIGQSHADKGMRYLKQIKQRYTECVYDTDNVAVCQTEKPGNFLQFAFLNYSNEWEHLKQASQQEPDETEQKIRELKTAEPQLTAYAIAKKLCTDETKFASLKIKVSRVLARMDHAGSTEQ